MLIYFISFIGDALLAYLLQTRKSSGDEIANVNFFLRQHRTHTPLYSVPRKLPNSVK